jgi:hypothetical protein
MMMMMMRDVAKFVKVDLIDLTSYFFRCTDNGTDSLIGASHFFRCRDLPLFPKETQKMNNKILLYHHNEAATSAISMDHCLVRAVSASSSSRIDWRRHQ